MDLIQMLIVSFMELTGLKDIVDILDDKIVSIIDLLEKRSLQPIRNGIK
jgi:hypothetical protein